MKRVLLYVGPVRLLEPWLAANLRMFAGKGTGSKVIRSTGVKKKTTPSVAEIGISFIDDSIAQIPDTRQ